MEKVEEVPTLELGKIGYEAYRAHAGGVSLAHGGALPQWSELEQKFVNAWNAAGGAIGLELVQEMSRISAKTGGKVKMLLHGDFSAVVEAEDPEEPKQHPTPEQVITPVQKPSIGRIVIYLNPESLDGPVGFGAHRCPAVVAHVAPWACEELMLYVMSPFGGCRFVEGVKQGAGMGQWSWPERVA